MITVGPSCTRRTLGVGGGSGCKIRVIASCFGGDAVCWVVLEHGVQELQAGRFKVGYKFARRLATPFGECGLEVGEGCHTRPVGFVGGAQESGSHVSICVSLGCAEGKGMLGR